MNDHRFKIIDGQLVFQGISFGYGNCNPVLVYQTSRHMVLRIPSRKDWMSLRTYGTRPAEWLLIEYEKEKETLRVKKVLKRTEPGRLWRRERDALVEEAKILK